jgi:adenylylsulfate kinase-like enzyme
VLLELQVILMAGLQGTGKTTACGKLALALKKQDKKVGVHEEGRAVRRTTDFLGRHVRVALQGCWQLLTLLH